MEKIQSFTQLTVWKKGHELVLSVYEATRDFPKEEKYGLIDQMRRSSVSITSNIAEGFSRIGKKEKIQFYYMAKGSLTELQNQLLISKDIGYLNRDIFTNLISKSIEVHKILNGLITSIKI